MSHDGFGSSRKIASFRGHPEGASPDNASMWTIWSKVLDMNFIEHILWLTPFDFADLGWNRSENHKGQNTSPVVPGGVQFKNRPPLGDICHISWWAQYCRLVFNSKFKKVLYDGYGKSQGPKPMSRELVPALKVIYRTKITFDGTTRPSINRIHRVL